MLRPGLIVGIAMLSATPQALPQATFQNIAGAISADDMTPDGRIVVGTLFSGGGYYWTAEDGITPIGGRSAIAISDDGNIIFGEIDDPQGGHVAAIWTEKTGWTSIGGIPGDDGCPYVSSPYEIAGDGSAAVGLGWDSCSGQGFRWTAPTGTQGLQMLGNGNNRASVVNNNGSVIGGFAQGSFSRTPAIWFDDLTGVLLDPPNGDVVGEVQGMNDDGTILLGNWNGSAFYYTESSGVVTFETPLPAWTGIAMDVSDNGTIVGFEIFQTARAAWVKFLGEDAVRLTTYLIQQGAGSVGLLEVAQAISTDGRVVIGHNFGQAWIATLFPAECPADVDGDGEVAFTDLLSVLSAWGPCPGCAQDIDGDDEVGFTDVLSVLAAWGSCE